MRALLAALLLLPAAALSAQKFDKETREFSSRNGAYRVNVSYAGTGGGGRARAALASAEGKKISAFETDRAPFTVTVSGDGRRLFFFCGSWGHNVSIYTLDIYSASGERLASHQVKMGGTAGEDFSADYSLYALGADQDGAPSILLIDAGTGKLLWRKPFRERLAGLKLSGAGARLLALFSGEGKKRRAVVFDRAGRELGSIQLTTANNLSPRFFNRDGSEFELWEDRTVYDEKDGYWHAKLVKKRFFRLSSSGVEAIGSKDLYEDYK